MATEAKEDYRIVALREVERRLARYDALQAVADAARQMPRATPAPGGCGTIHPFEIEASTVWALDLALKKLDALS